MWPRGGTLDKIDFKCGCSFPVENNKIKFKPNFDTLNYQCQDTWNLISCGDTKGVFQLETFLGQKFAERIKPRTVEELSDLVSLLRPGCLQAFMEDGKNVVEHYRMRKFQEEEPIPIHDSLRGLLDDTYFLLLYQEQAMSIAAKIAGFTPSETDEKIRKVLGKKQSDKINEVKKYFLEGCKKTGIVNEEDAERIFSWIAAGQRYSFNKSICPSTMVITKEGIKTITDLQIGEYILAPKNNTEDEWVEVTNKYDHGDQDLYEITLENGNTIKCTMEHKFLCDDGNIRRLKDIINSNHKIMAHK